MERNPSTRLEENLEASVAWDFGKIWFIIVDLFAMISTKLDIKIICCHKHARSLISQTNYSTNVNLFLLLFDCQVPAWKDIEVPAWKQIWVPELVKVWKTKQKINELQSILCNSFKFVSLI